MVALALVTNHSEDSNLNGDIILGQIKFCFRTHAYTLKPLFNPDTCASAPPKADMLSNSAPLKKDYDYPVYG
jgi:hypothetical protein